jgi:hypothetical protein
MIDVIGKKRLAVIIGLALLLGLLSAGQYFYLVPAQQELSGELRSVRGKLSTKKAEIRRMENEFQQIQEQKVYFGNLQDAGFIYDQSRAVASRRIEQVQEFSKVLSAQYTINPAEIKETKATKDAGYVILSSPITINLEALDDVDIYKFIFWLEQTFPGQISVKNIRFEKMREINEARLRSIGSGSPVVMVEGEIDVDWETLAPAEDVGQEGQGS